MEKEAKHGDDIYALVAWADANRKQLMWTLGAVVVAGILVGLYFMRKTSREAAANEAFCALKIPVPGRDEATAALAAQFAQVGDEYPGTSGGVRALLEAGTIYFEAGEFEQARVMFQKVLAEHGDYPLASQAAIGVAVSLEAEGNLPEATARYEEIVRRGTVDSTLPQAQSALARLYTEQNHPDRAFELYKQMLGARGSDSWTMEAQVQARELLEKYPALKQQLAPPAASATSAPVPAAGKL
jgi:predicted negative regulator of RcsB-dependent stress response